MLRLLRLERREGVLDQLARVLGRLRRAQSRGEGGRVAGSQPAPPFPVSIVESRKIFTSDRVVLGALRAAFIRRSAMMLRC